MEHSSLTTEVTDVNRLATICLATLIATPLSTMAQDAPRGGLSNRPISITTVPARSSTRASMVPRPARPNIGQLASSRTLQDPILEESEMLVEPSDGIMDGTEYNAEYIEDGMVYEDGPMYYDEPGMQGHCDSCGDSGCASCAKGAGEFDFDLCAPGAVHKNRQLVIRLPSHGWVSVDYLGWFASGMNMPPLVTTSAAGTPQANAGVLPGSSVLFGGNNNNLDDNMSGVRLRVGLWSTVRPNFGAEGEYFGFSQQTESFDRNSTGTPILARPFYNNATGLQDAELVAFPNLLSGRIQVQATSQVDAAAVRFRHILCCSTKAACSPWDCGPIPAQSRIDATLGWRYMQLREGLMIQEDLTSLSSNNPGSFLIEDNFETFNQFNGAELGVQWTGRRGYWTLDSLMRLSLGISHQQLTITGSTESPTGSAPANGGLLAQPGRNIGTISQTEFGVLPELGTTLGYQLTQRLKFNLGYTAIYWSNVVRPGDQIDTTVNPNLLPPAIASNAFNGPGFTVRQSDYWLQGLSFGGEYRW